MIDTSKQTAAEAKPDRAALIAEIKAIYEQLSDENKRLFEAAVYAAYAKEAAKDGESE